jgi:hypothetical protein
LGEKIQRLNELYTTRLSLRGVSSRTSVKKIGRKIM